VVSERGGGELRRVSQLRVRGGLGGLALTLSSPV
jgi:hypothetical protein